MARQYFNGSSADSLIVTASTGSITTITGIFTPAQANQAFPLPVGIGNQPFAGQVFRFAAGGIMTTGTAGTIVVTPVFGPSTAQAGLTGAVSLGASAAQTYVASLTNVPWRLEGELVFRTIALVATTSTAWCSGVFSSQGTLATAGSGLTVVFGSTAAVNVDTLGTGAAGSFGALNFGITFSVAGTVQAAYTSMQSLN
jgi:hypothetical protein